MFTIIMHKNDAVKAFGMFESEDLAHRKLKDIIVEYGIQEQKDWDEKGYDCVTTPCYVLGQEDKEQTHVAVDCISTYANYDIRYSRALFTIVEIC